MLDGRCRLDACLRLKVPVRHTIFKGTDDEALKVTLALNLHRRHLTMKQKATLADKIATYKVGGDRRSNRHVADRKDTSIKDAAEQVGVSPRSVERSRRVRKKATPAVQEAVDEGRLELGTGARVAGLSKEKQDAIAAAKDPKAAANKEFMKQRKTTPCSRYRVRGVQSSLLWWFGSSGDGIALYGRLRAGPDSSGAAEHRAVPSRLVE